LTTKRETEDLSKRLDVLAARQTRKINRPPIHPEVLERLTDEELLALGSAEAFDAYIEKGGIEYAQQQEARLKQLRGLQFRTPEEQLELEKLEEDEKRPPIKVGRPR
jgi:hypothetical protein